MFVETDTEIPPPRCHPWTVVTLNPEAQYWNFRLHPEDIPTALEDFRPWAHYPAIQSFYGLLAWINGNDSIFESNDSGLRPPKVDPETPELVRHVFDADPVGVHGRLAIIFRNLEWNAERKWVEWLKAMIHKGLRDNVPNFPSAIMVGEWPHLFTQIDKEGLAVTLRFWAWGDDEASAMENLRGTFEVIHQCLQWISNDAKRQTSRPAPAPAPP